MLHLIIISHGSEFTKLDMHGLSVLINDLKRKKGNFLLTGQKIDKTLPSASSKTI